MRARLLLAVAVISLSAHSAFASSSADYAGDDVSSGFNWTGSGGLLAAGGAAGLTAGLVSMFSGGSTGAHAAVSTSPAVAPEISTSGSAAGFALMAGGTLVARGRRRKQ